MLIKYVLFAIVIVLLASILYDGFRQYLARRKETRTLNSKQDAPKEPSDGAGDSSADEQDRPHG